MLVARVKDQSGAATSPGDRAAATSKLKDPIGAVLVAHFHKHAPSDLASCWGFLKEFFLRCIMCPPFLNHSAISARSDVADKVMGRFHRAHANKPHIYVQLMAVDPAGQGKGLCSRLMRTINKAQP